MEQVAPAVQRSDIAFFLSGGGLPLLAIGLAMSLWAVFNIAFSPSRRWMLVQCFWSLLPGVIAIVVIYQSYVEFAELAIAPQPPKPAVFAKVTGRIISCGFLGLISTILPVTLGLIGIARTPVSYVQSPEEN